MRRAILRIGSAIAILAALGSAVYYWPEIQKLWHSAVDSPSDAALDEEEEAPAAPIELVADGWCQPHAKPESDCEQCRAHPTPNSECVERLPLIRLSGPDIAQRIGLQTATIESQVRADSIAGNAEITYDDHAYAEVLPRVGGLVRDVNADHGRKVKPGDVLCVIDSAEVGAAKAQYLAAAPLVQLAEATEKRTLELTRANALPLKNELEARTATTRAKADLLNARQRLRNFGFADAELEAIERDNDTSSLLRVVSPIEGTVIERHLVTGEAVAPTHQLVLVADLRVMWAWIDVHEADASRVKPGQKVKLTVSGLEGRVYEGSVHFIDSAVNRTTRTVRVVAEIENVDGQLRANQFGRGEIIVGEPHDVVLVPRDAVQTLGAFEVVFVPRADGAYRPQRVVLGPDRGTDRGMLEVSWGVNPGDTVVTTGSFLLKSEVIRMTEGLGDD